MQHLITDCNLGLIQGLLTLILIPASLFFFWHKFFMYVVLLRFCTSVPFSLVGVSIKRDIFDFDRTMIRDNRVKNQKKMLQKITKSKVVPYGKGS